MELIRSAFESWKAGPSRRSLIVLLEASQHAVYGTCFEVLRHRQDAEDAAQRVLVELQEGLDHVGDADHFLKRLRLVAFRTALDAQRGRRRRMDRERKAFDMNPPAPISDEVREAIHEAMAALDDESRALVIEHYFEKATLDDMAARRGVSAAAIWKRIENVKGRLREGLALTGLAAAASQAEACLESAAMAAPSANLVTGATLVGGGLMAAKTSTAAAAALVATLTFALGLGGGLAIQASRTPAPPSVPPVARHDPSTPKEPPVVPEKGAAPRGSESQTDPAPASVDSAEDRLKLAREIWAQFSRPRFWKDKEAQDETLPKLDLLGPEQAAFFIEKFRDPDVKHAQKKDAVRLAVTCGGPDAATLILELIDAPESSEARDYRLLAKIALQNPDRRPELPIEGVLWDRAMAFSNTAQGWDRVLAWNILTYGDSAVWKPILMEAARSVNETMCRSEAVELLVMRAGPEMLPFLRENKEAIRTMTPDPRYGAGAQQEVERQRDRLGRVVDNAIQKLEQKLNK